MPLAKLKQIRDHNQTIYFAQQDQSNFNIIVFELDKHRNIKCEEIFQCTARQIRALEIDYDNVQGIKHEDSNRSASHRKSFFVLDSGFMLYHVERMP